MKTRLLFLNQCFDKTRLRNLIAWVLFTKGEKETIEIVEKLKGLGFQFATRAGISLSIDDLKIPSEKAPLVSQAKQQVALATSQYEKGNVTSIEKLQQLVDTWHRTSETLKQTVVSNFQATDKLSPVYMMAFSGARGNISQVRQLAGMRGLMADPQGQIIGFPIRSNFREGLTLTEYMISCYGARKGLVDTALRTADAGYLTRRLVDVSQHMVVKASTCATRRGIVLYELAISGKSALSLRDRLVGRVLAQDVYDVSNLSAHTSPNRVDQGVRWSSLAVINAIDEEGVEERREPVSSPTVKYLPHNMTKVGERNQEISANLASQIASVQKRVSVRSPLTCSIRHGVCQLCYGWSLSEGRLVNLGEAVGIIAAQSIGEPGTQLTMRTFHTGGVFSGDVMTEIRAPYQGAAHFSNPLQGLLIRTSHGKIAFLTKSPGEVAIQAHINTIDGRYQDLKSFRQKGKRDTLQGGNILPSAREESIIEGTTLKGSLRSLMQLKPKETVFALEASTVVFVRQHEKVIQTQLIAEFSSMGTEINETIEAKRTLFANNAGQISFASLLIGKRIRENGDVVRVSRNLGFVWILSGKQPGPVALLDLLQRGTHIVNQNTIVTKVPCLDGTGTSFFGSLRDPEPKGSLNEPTKKKVSDNTLRTWQSPLKIVLLGERVKRASAAGFESLVAAKAVKKFLPSILYSWARLTSNKSFAGNKCLINAIDHYLASSNQYISKGVSDSLSSDNRSDNYQQALRLLFRPISLDKKAGTSLALGIETSPVREAEPPQRFSPPFTRSAFNRSALCKQPYVSYSPVAVAHSLYSNKAFEKRVTSDNTSVWIFPSQYQTQRNGLAWFDSRHLSQKLNLGEVIWIETEAASLCGTNIAPTASSMTLMSQHFACKVIRPSSLAEGRKGRAASKITAVNPLAGQPSTYSKLNNSNVETLHNEWTHVAKEASLPKVTKSSQKVTSLLSAKERHEMEVKTWLKQTRVSPLRRGETEYLVTSTNFPNLFAKESRISSNYLVNKKAQQQKSHRAVLDTSWVRGPSLARFAHSRHQHKKRTTTKSWVVTFDKSQNFSKKRAFTLQNEYFFRGPVMNRKADKVTMSQGGSLATPLINVIDEGQRGAEDCSFLFKNVGTQRKMEGGSTEQTFINGIGDRQQKSASCWVYCPQQTQKVLTLHESINFYRNRQFDKLTFDSSLVYTKAWLNSELLYSVKNNLEWIASKLSLFSERDTAFRESSPATSPPLVEALQRQTSHCKPRFLTIDLTISALPFQFKSHLFLTPFQDVRANRQHRSLYFNSFEGPGKREDKYSNQETSISSSQGHLFTFGEGHSSLKSEGIESSNIPSIEKQRNGSFLLHFAGFTDAALKNVPLKMKMGGQFGLKGCFPLKGSESRNVGHIRSFAKSRASSVGFKSRVNGLDVFPQMRPSSLAEGRKGQLIREFVGHPRASSMGEVVKKEGLLFLRKLMQVPQGSALHERTVFFDKWDKALSLAEVLQPESKAANSIDIVESATQSNPRIVKISVLPDLKTAYKLSFDTRNCFYLSQHKQLSILKIRSNPLETFPSLGERRGIHLQENDKTERYKFLVWKNLMNCKPFLLLRTSSLQVQVVSNTRARSFLPISVEHPLMWHSLVGVRDSLAIPLLPSAREEGFINDIDEGEQGGPYKYSHDSLRENLQTEVDTYQKSWHKAENRGSLPVASQLEAVQNDLEVLKYQKRQKGFLHQLSLRQQISLGALHLGTDGGKTFFDNLTKQVSRGQPRVGYRVSEIQETPLSLFSLSRESDGLQSDVARSSPNSSLNGMKVLFCRDLNQSIAKGQQNRVSWPYSPQAILLTAVSKGSSITLPSRTRLTTNYTTLADSVASSMPLMKERIRTLARARFANLLQRQMDQSNLLTLGARDQEAEAPSWLNPSHLGLQSPKPYTSLFKFVTKIRRTPLITNRKPTHLSLASLLLTTDFCTKVVSNSSYLIRFRGTINLPSSNRGSGDVTHLLTSLKRNTDDSIRVESQNSFGDDTGGIRDLSYASNISRVLDESTTAPVGGISHTLETSKSPAYYVTGANSRRPGPNSFSAFDPTKSLQTTNLQVLTTNLYASDNKWGQSASLQERLSPATGELVSQDFLLDDRCLGMSTPPRSASSHRVQSYSASMSLMKPSSLAEERRGVANEPFSQSHRFFTKSEHNAKDSHSNTVLLTESDQISMSLSNQRIHASVGQFVTLGEEFVSNYAALASGQIVAIEENKITLRRTQALLFYAQGVTHVNHGQWVNKNAPILTLTYQKLVTGDIVQGIPKIEQFFEAPATRDGEPLSNSLQARLRKSYNRLKNSLPHVQAVKHSLEEIQQVLVEGILRVYLSQGVRIADKHLEIVIRQMTSKGQILDVGNTGLFQGEFVNLDRIERINLGTYGQKAEYEPSVLGITQASLGAESFISAASFQETTRVLSRDTIVGKTDFLRGLKERVVLGDVIQAGTGLDDNINYGLLFGVTET